MSLRLCRLTSLLVFMLLMPLAQAAADPWAARSDRYSVEWGSISLGDGTIALQPKGNGCFDYHSETRPIALVRWTYGAPEENSEFCLVQGEVQARRFIYRNGKKSADSFSIDFDPKTGHAKLIRRGTVTELEVPAGTTDRFSVREAVRAWVISEKGRIGAERDFQFVDDDKLRHYRFAIKAAETVKTEAGSFETLRVERIDNPKKSYRYWLAPSRAYVPVKIEHINKGKVELRMSLLPDK